MSAQFELAAGSIVGINHRQRFVWKNNQDAYALRRNENLTVAVVADGCGDGAYSEFGARLGANMFAHRLTQLFSHHLHSGRIDDFRQILDGLERLRISMIVNLRESFNEISDGSLSQAVIDHLLFTLLSLVITPTLTYVIGIGDGVYAINGEVKQIGPFLKNAPPYLAYGGLVKSNIDPGLCQFIIHQAILTPELNSACIGTDGAADFEKISDLPLPGKNEKKEKKVVGPLSQFWTDDKYFGNPEALRRRLNLINDEVTKPDWENQELNYEHGLLTDDTTIVVARRRLPPKIKE